MQEILDGLSSISFSGEQLQGSVLATLATIAVFAGLRFVVLRVVYRRVDDTKLLYQWRKTIRGCPAGC